MRPVTTTWQAADVEPGGADLMRLFHGTDAVIHLAWKSSPPITRPQHGASTSSAACASSTPSPLRASRPDPRLLGRRVLTRTQGLGG
ncbi:hypothetical protein SSAG_01088 [Streptomyces sp. Mg1]|nr:hypothetical protein SSAG_01088 [Streptomyces sp. Mg1]